MFEMMMIPSAEMRVTPALVNLAQILALPTMSLHQLVQQELESNPALEEIEYDENRARELDSSVQANEHLYALLERLPKLSSSEFSSDEAVDPLLFVSMPHSTTESLLTDLRASLPREDHAIAFTLIESLNDQGFLEEEVNCIAQMLQVHPDRVETVLERLQEIGPPGIATRDVRGCLLAQIALLAAQGISVPYCREIVRDHLADLGANHCKQIAQKLRITVGQVEAVREFIQEHCWPYPVQSMRNSAAHTNRPRYTIPDVAIIARGTGFVATVLHTPHHHLQLNPLYQELAHKSSQLGEEERAHVKEYILRSRTFLKNLNQRETMIQRISQVIIDRQEAFLRKGVRHLEPLTRADIAAEIGVHESTVSRATADKTVLLPDGSLMPFADFFVASRPVEDILREMIANETTPLSDANLSRLLNERGHAVARRTVTKYRERMQILPSTLR